jgi:hypothetical protein
MPMEFGAIALFSVAVCSVIRLVLHYHQMVSRPCCLTMSRADAQDRIPPEPVGAALYLTTRRSGFGCLSASQQGQCPVTRHPPGH